MIKVKTTDELLHEKYEHFDPEGNSLGFLDDIQNMDLRVQIRENKAEGYYFMVGESQVMINSFGKAHFPTGVYDTWGDLAFKLI